MKEEIIKVGSRNAWMHRSIKNPDFESSTVLTNDPWLFVELWIKRKKEIDSDAIYFWNQSRKFYEASRLLPTESAPLTIYYSFLNASKALLKIKSQHHRDIHGVGGARPDFAKSTLNNEIINFKNSGILPSLCNYFDEPSTHNQYKLKDLLWNLPYIHRSFKYTYNSSPDLFIPLENACYVKRDTTEGWFQAEVARRYSDKRVLKHLPGSIEVFNNDGKVYIRRKKRFKWFKGRTSRNEKKKAENRLSNYHSKIRRVIVPIHGDNDYWYLKKEHPKNNISRHSITISFAAMHRLSELSRYDPKGLDRHLSGQANWLLTEFIDLAPKQFIDQIATDITGLEFRNPGARS